MVKEDGGHVVDRPRAAGRRALVQVRGRQQLARRPGQPGDQGRVRQQRDHGRRRRSLGGVARSADGGPRRRRAPEQGASDHRANTPLQRQARVPRPRRRTYETSCRANGRYELRRPQLNFDLDTDIRISEVLAARWLMKIDAEQEALDFYQTRLTFDRGNLTFRKDEIELFAYDNERAGTWDDPLHLVGNIGIYAYDYGYNRRASACGRSSAASTPSCTTPTTSRPAGRPARPSRRRRRNRRSRIAAARGAGGTDSRRLSFARSPTTTRTCSPSGSADAGSRP